MYSKSNELDTREPYQYKQAVFQNTQCFTILAIEKAKKKIIKKKMVMMMIRLFLKTILRIKHVK